jgi:DegV family protein with EDD domain
MTGTGPLPWPVAVVTDSTAHLSDAEVSDLDVAVVPLEVVISGRSGLDMVEVTPQQVAAALSAWEPVTTSRPSPARLLSAYERARERGATAVVSVHLSAGLSGTVDAARLAAREARLPVTVIDSQQIGLGLGFAVLQAARRARAGAEADQVAGVAQQVLAGTHSGFYVDTLEHLRRGGRMGATSALVGGVLSVKPLLVLRQGQIEPLEKVRTATRALARLVDLAVDWAAAGPCQVGVQHLAAPERAEHVAAMLVERLPQAGEVQVRELGAVIGAHVGPGVVAVAVAPVVE